MSRTDYGQIDVDLSGEVYTLKPTLEAMLSINDRYEGLRNAVVRVQAIDARAIASIIVDGAGLDRKQAESVPQAVLEAGVIRVSEQVTSYLLCLFNPGGHDAADDGRGEGGDAGKA